MTQPETTTTSIEAFATTLHELATQQLEAAETDEWEVVFDLADRREDLMQHLAQVKLDRVPASKREMVTRTIMALQAIDLELTDYATRKAEQTAEELEAVRRGRVTVHGYNWAGNADSVDSVYFDRHG